MRAHRAERRRQDDVLQRAQRLRAADRRRRARVRRRPAGDGRLPAGALGRAAHVPDRAGHRQPSGVRERAAGPRAHERRAVEPPPARERSDRVRRPRRRRAARRSARSAPRSAASSRWPAPSSARPGSCCSTSPPPAFPRRRRSDLGEVIRSIPERDRRPGHPRRPRHEPRVGMLRDDGGARLRPAHRVGRRRQRCCATST